MVDVIQQLDPRRINALHHADAPSRVIALVIVVVNLAVEQFQVDGDARVLGDFAHCTQADDAVLGAFLRRAAPCDCRRT